MDNLITTPSSELFTPEYAERVAKAAQYDNICNRARNTYILAVRWNSYIQRIPFIGTFLSRVILGFAANYWFKFAIELGGKEYERTRQSKMS